MQFFFKKSKLTSSIFFQRINDEKDKDTTSSLIWYPNYFLEIIMFL